MAEYIACRRCDSPDCKGCNLKRLETMLKKGKFDLLMNQNLAINASSDVAPVVRCKDCKYWHKETLFCDYMPYGEARERVNWYDDDFCSYGERKDSDSNAEAD